MSTRATRRIRAFAVGCAIAIGAAAPAGATQVYSGPLYDHSATGSEHWKYERAVVERDGRVSVYNTREPRIAVHLPEERVANGAGVVLLPGGGLRVLGMGEGTQQEIDAFLKHGVAVIVLEYRTLQQTPEAIERASAPPPPRPEGAPPMRFPKMEIRNGNANPAPDNPELNEVLRLSTADAQEALRLAHEKADEWGLDPDRIGAIGTSAGGGVAFGALLADAPPDTKPDFLISIFGPALQDVTASEDAPPLFLVTEADHGPVTDGLLSVFSIWKDSGQKVELHVYEVPNFSMTVDLWGPRLFDWMVERSIIPAAE